MATKKDLVEAYSFSRRRLVTAFVSGAPGGREVEPTRPGRMIIGGIALAILLMAGAAVAGALTKRASPDFDKPGLVTDDRGALYIILQSEDSPGEPVLRPVINVTSAQLILGDAGKVTKVPDKELAAQEKGPAIGILDAPAIVPSASDLLNSAWTSCTATGAGVRTEVVPSPQVEPTPDRGFVVRGRTSKKRYLIAEAASPEQPVRAYRYALPDNSDDLLDSLRSLPDDEISVPDEWLALFPGGGSLDEKGLGIPHWGDPVTLDGYPKGTLVGDIDASRTGRYVITNKGPVALTPFAEQVVKNTSLGKRKPQEVEPDVALNIASETPYDDAQWPSGLLAAPVDSTDQLCGVLQTAEDTMPAVRLATNPAGSPMLDDVTGKDDDVRVEPGYGALVRSGGWMKSTGGTAYLVDDGGRSYSIAGQLEVANLGYEKVDPVVVPETWIQLFRPSADLSRLAALCPPRESDPGAKPSKTDTC
ncbi:MAG: type VII secretion protein EccB [Nocardioidaceae bacterium]|nr:type VII secretion protein EccB [Nocardioidaceae bacterium]